MTAKQERFCREYLIDLNATQAAIRAGYSEKTANEQGSRLLANVKISKFIETLRQEAQQRMEWTFDDSVRELMNVINDKKNRGNVKVKAVEVLNKMYGYDAPQKIDHSGQINIPAIKWVETDDGTD